MHGAGVVVLVVLVLLVGSPVVVDVVDEVDVLLLEVRHRSHHGVVELVGSGVVVDVVLVLLVGSLVVVGSPVVVLPSAQPSVRMLQVCVS